MPLVSDRCISIRKYEYSETSQILTLLTRRRGLVRVLAKGAHRTTKAGAGKFDGGVDLLQIGDGMFTDDPARDLATLAEWKLREGFPALRRSLRGLYLGLFAAELVGATFEEHDPHPELFDALEELLAALSGESAEEHFLIFELRLLRLAGFSPELDACIVCGSPAESHFSPARGGVVCPRCAPTIPDTRNVDPRLLRLLRLLRMMQGLADRGGRLPRLTRHQTDPLNRLLTDHIQHALGKKLVLPSYIIPRAK